MGRKYTPTTTLSPKDVADNNDEDNDGWPDQLTDKHSNRCFGESVMGQSIG